MATKKPYTAQPMQTIDFDRLNADILSLQPAEPESPRGLLRGAADLGLEAASGAAKGIKFMSDVFGADNPVSQGLQGVSDFAKELQSAQAKGEDQRIAQLMKEAEDKGIGEQVKAALRAAGEAPVRQAIGAIGTSVPMIAASMVPGLREASWGTRAAALGGMGGAQGVGVVKSSMYDAVYQRAIEEGRGEQEARALAQQAQAYSPENAGDIALGGVLGVGAALTGFEPAAARAVGGAAAKTAAAKTAQRGLMQSTLRGTLAEMIPEGTQGFQEQVAGNRAEQRAGFDTPTFRGAAGSATLEGLLSAPGGAVGGMLDARGAKPAPKLLADQIRATESVPETGPMTRAANQAVEAKAQQVEMTAGAEGAALAAMEKQAQDDLKGLRDFAGRSSDVVGGMPVAGAQSAAPGAEPSAEFIDSPFLDRIQTVQEMLADPATREKVRARWGDEGLNNIAYYAGMANRTGLPEKTQENLLGMAERLLSESVLTPIQPTPELDGMRRDPLTLGNQPQPATPALGMDGTPSGRFTVDPQGNVSPESRAQRGDAQRRADEIDSLGRQTPRGQAQPTATMQGALGIGMDTAPTGRLLAGQDGVRPETRMDAINIGQADMQRQAEVARRAEMGLTPDIEAVQQRNAMRPLDGDILNPSGKPFKTLMAAQRAAKKNPGQVVEVTGGFAIRPATMVAAQPEVANDGRGNQDAAGLAEALAVGNSEAGDRAATEPAAVARGEMLDAIPGQPAGDQPAQGDAGQDQRVGREGYDTPIELDAAQLKTILEKTRKAPLVDKPAKLEAWRTGTAKTDPNKYPVELAFTTDGRLDVNDGRHRIALAAERGEKVTAFIDGKDAQRAQELLANVQNLPQPAAAQAPADQAPEAARGDGAAPAGIPEQGGSAAAVEAAGVDQQTANNNPASEGKKPTREEIEAEVVRQVSDAWDKQTSGGFVVNQHYPAVVRVNGQERKLGLFKKKGSGTLYAEALEQTVYGPSFTQFKVTEDGKLEKVGDRNLYGRDKAVADQAIAEFNSLFDGREKAASQQAQDETPFIHAGLKIKTQRIKVGNGVEARWVVQSPENAEREARGERQIGGDRIVDSREQAIQVAEEEVARDADDKARKAAIDAERKVQADAEEARKAANRGKTVAERRSSAILDKQTKLPTSLGLGNGSRRQAMENAVEQGRAIVATQVRDDTAKRRDEAIVATAKRAGYMLGLSNENIPVVKAALEADKRLKANDYQKTEYRVYSGSNTTRDSFAEISKTEYDYAQELLAKRDVNPEQDKPAAAKDRKLESLIKIAADSVEQLRKADVDRVLNEAPQESRSALAKYISAQRPDLAGEAADVMQEVKQSAQEAQPEDGLPEGWKSGINGFTKRPFYRKDQDGGLPFAVVQRTDIGYDVQIRLGDKLLNEHGLTGAAKFEALAKADEMLAAQSVHKDPGKPAETVTQPVIQAAMKKAARNEDTKPSEMRTWLLGEIDKALQQAPDLADYDATVKRVGEKDAVSMFTGSGLLGKNSETGYVTFDVPGDGTFKVRNSVRGLLEFKRKVAASPGFKDRGQDRVRPEEADSVRRGSGGLVNAFNNMVEDGDLEAASDYADAVGLELDAKKVTGATKVLRWRESRDAAAEKASIDAAMNQSEVGQLAPARPDAGRRADELQPATQEQAAEAPADTPKLTQAEAAQLMEWQDMGQKNGVKTHALRFYASQADKDSKRGVMTLITVSKGDVSDKAWTVDGDDQKFGMLAQAKKRGMELGMARAVKDGFVEAAEGRAVVSTANDKLIGKDINGNDVFMGTDGPLKGVPYHFDERGQVRTGVAMADQTPQPAAKATEEKPADDKPRLTDAGEELTRNRRNRVTGISWADVEGMNDTLKVKTVTKANVWQKPNYEKMVEEGAPRWKAAILKAIYDKLAAKPDSSRALTDDQMKRYIETMAKVRDAVMAELDRVENSAAVKSAFESEKVKSFVSAKGDDMVQAAAIMGLRGVLDGKRILEAVFPKPEGAKLGHFDRTTEQGKDNNTNALLIGGNNALQAMQFNYKAITKARDLLMEGFPAKQEAWAKSYNITSKDGRYFVVKKGYTFRRADDHPVEGFETQEQAQEFAREITKRSTDKPLPPSRGLDLADAKRTGPDWRNGKDVTSDEVKEAFGFRGVNLGEYVKSNQKIAQLHLNSAYDALMDLSDLMGVPPKAISLNGTLGLAIGAQGSGRALAHFVPGVNEINITRDSGAGALAHEWAHAMDHYFGVQNSERIAKSEEPFLTEHLSGKPDGVRPEVFEAFKTLMEVMKRKPMTQDEAREWLKNERVKAERALKFTLENTKVADQATFDELSAKLMAGDVGDVGPDGVPVNITGLLKSTKAGITQATRLNMAAMRVNALRDEVRFLNTHKPQDKTSYVKASSALDAGRVKAYWSTNVEMFARAFESYVMDAMAERQRESLYLSGLSDSPAWQEWEKKTGQLSPYPKADERLAINQAAQALVNAIETRETDKGVAMFSRIQDASQGQGIGQQQAQSIVDAITARWDNAPDVLVAADMNDTAIPQAVRDYDAEQRKLGATGEPEGFYYKGKVYVVASTLRTPTDVMRVLFHESLGHYGLRGVFGKALDPILNQIAALRRADVQAKADEYGLDLSKPDERLQAAEEVLSVFAQTKPELGYVKRAIAAIRSWMRRTFPKLFGQMKLTDAEIIRDYILPARGWVERGPGGGPKGGLPAMSRGTPDGMAQNKPLTEKQFYRTYYQHRMLRGPDDAAAIMRDGWQEGGIGPNVLPAYQGGQPSTILERKYMLRAGDTALLIPKEGVRDTPNGPKVRAGWKPRPYEVVQITSDGPAMYQEYLQALKAWQDSMTGNANPDIRFSRTAAAKAFVAPAMDKLNETFSHPGKLSWWHKTVGSMYNLAERMPAFKPVYNAAQNFINDVSFYAIEAADKAPRLLPRLEDWKDLAKSPITAQDNKAVAAPVFEGTLSWRRDESGKPVLVEDLAKRYAGLTPEQKAQRLLRANAISENVLKMWQGMPKDQYASSVNTAFEGRMLKAGIVFTPDELKSIFKLNDAQVALYQEFRQSIDASLDNMGKSDLLRVAGKDAADLKDAVMSAPDVDAAAVLLRDHLLELAKENPDRSDALVTTANDMITRAEKVQRLKSEGYAPLSRFGQYTVDVVVDGERQYFSMFETARDANRMAAKLKIEYGAENVAQGTLSQREFEMLQGITPESLELFGNMLGLDSTGNEAQDQVFQEYLKRTKANRSAMKRLIHRKGIAGYSEDVGRVLAAFVYSNARQTSAALHMGDLGEAVMAIPKGEGELKDAAVELARYVKEPREEAAKMRGWLFAQYLGGSIASAIVNFTQPLTTSAPYLSQFGGMGKSVKALYQAMADLKDKKFEAGLAESFKKRTEDGTLAPQGVHELMAQSRGEATLRTGDGTQMGDALAKGRNTMAKVMIGWGKLFGMAEQINRQSTYVAAYRMAVERGMANPDAFAKKVVDETQFVNNKANKMKFGRGAIGATLMTFKSYSLNWLELFHRLSTQNGREGKMAAAWMLGVLLLSAGASGLPFAEDAEDLADFLAQRLGYNWSSKKARQQFLEDLFGRDIAGFVENGVTGLPGAPIDVSGRLGMGNMIPGTGLFLSKKDHTSDFTEVLGPAGDLAKRAFQAGDLLLSGEVKEAAFMVAPKAIGNLQKGVDMAATGLYRDARSYTVYSATPGEAVGKAIGFQPRSIAQMQEANGLNQRTKDFYRLKVERINAKWAKAIFEKDAATVDEVRAEIKEWNRQNPDQRIQANIPAILRRVKEMRKTKAERIADTAPKALRASMQEEARRMREEQ